jgi:sterile alpha motif and leucine zipper containing kinase AZK
MDGFYDVYGIDASLIERGKMPLLVDLKTVPTSRNVDYEVISVNRVVDVELSQLEEKACALFEECSVTELGLFLSGLIQKLADVVVNRMGGPVGSADNIMTKWDMRSRELRDSLRTVVLPLGCLDVGLSRHRALLFKVRFSQFITDNLHIQFGHLRVETIILLYLYVEYILLIFMTRLIFFLFNCGVCIWLFYLCS